VPHVLRAGPQGGARIGPGPTTAACTRARGGPGKWDSSALRRLPPTDVSDVEGFDVLIHFQALKFQTLGSGCQWILVG